ncbi:hypothetical protein ACWGGS_20230 [Streptomyces decoyicus]
MTTPEQDRPSIKIAEDWWAALGGTLDRHSNTVFVPQGSKVPPCRFPCFSCRAKGRQ